MWRTSASLGLAGLAVCLATGGLANPPQKSAGGGHPAPHVGGGAPHLSAPRAAPHFNARHVTPHLNARHVTPHFNAGGNVAQPNAQVTRPGGPGNAARAHVDPRNFASRRQFAGDPAFRRFLNPAWHRNHHLGWVGPLFWPYAYGDLFYGALWPDEYGDFDPFWAYGYNDIYEGIFSPYDYSPYVQEPPQMAALTQSMSAACASEAAEVTAWPIDQIQQVVQPNDQQQALLNELGNAVTKVANVIQSQCPTGVAFTPTDRLAQMQQRLQALIETVNIVESPLSKFYDALSDEQKARFNDVGVQRGKAPTNAQAPTAANQAACGEAMAWPTEKIDQLVQPTDVQRPKLEALQAAAAQAADIVKAACPSETPATPPTRLAALGQRLDAELKAVQTIGAPLQDFYASLSNDQKARFNTLGQQIFAAQ